MMYYTHLAFGLLVSLILLDFFSINNKIIFIATAMFFSIFPDIDETKSRIGRKNRLVSRIINFFFGHRGIIHSIYLPLLLFIIFNFINSDIAIAILIGYFSHLFLDALTPRGIRPLYPIFNKRINGFIKTNSLLEKLVFLGLVSANFYLIVTYI